LVGKRLKETDNEMVFIGGGARMVSMRSHIFDQLRRLQMCFALWRSSANVVRCLRPDPLLSVASFSIVLTCVLLIGACGDAAARDDPIVITGPTMGTTYAVKLYDASGNVDTAALQSRIDALLERINDQMSTWRPDSELSRFNNSQDPGWFPVSAETAYVVKAAAAISALSDGAFDVTVGPIVNLWGFGPEGSNTGPPSEQEIEKTMDRVGYRQLNVRASPSALRKQHSDVYVDLSAIAKGFAVDEVTRLLGDQGIQSYLVEIGGELRARGSKPDGSFWNVGIERPLSGERSVQSVVALREAAIATSGDYRNYVEKDGKRYSHTINPRTGRPIAHGLASVSVITASAMRADALATAIMVMGPEEGYQLAVREALAVQLIIRSGDYVRVLATPQFESYLLR
jgi:thiamine biosynthesis lipoprotein